jgi:hypothetical protein
LPRAGFPVEIKGSAQNAPGQTFKPTTELQRPGLLLMDGVVYAAFGGHCDVFPYQGWVFGVSTAGEIKARWAAVPAARPGFNGNGAGIWQSGSGLMSDGPGRIFLATGNGGSPTPPLAGNTPNGMFGESVLRLGVQPDGTLTAQDFFAPYDAARLDEYDADFASGGVTALDDDHFGTAAHPHLAVAVGKAGYVYLLDRDDLGGIGTGPAGGDRVLSRAGPRGGVWARPAVWPGDGGWVIVPTASGNGADDLSNASSGYLDYYRYGESGTGDPSLAFAAQSDDGFGFSSSAPVVTSDGTASGSALAWVIWAGGAGGEGAQLRAYDAVPDPDGRLRLRFTQPIGQSSKFAMPGVGRGRIYVPTRDGHVLGFGAPVKTELEGPSTTFPVTTIGQQRVQTVTLTATAPLDVTGVASSASSFTVPSAAALALPRTLATGDTIQVPVTFAPTAPGTAAGALNVTTSKGGFAFGLSGIGQAESALLTATPATISFGGATVGHQLTGTMTFGNGGGQDLTITGLDAPAAPFTLSGAPPVGAKIAPGRRIDVTVTFAPTAAGSFADEVTLHTSAGDKTIGLSGTAGVGAHLSLDPAAGLAFGDVVVGETATRALTLTNAGDVALTINKSKPPVGGAFTALDELSEATTILPGASRTLRVAFAPGDVGDASDTWKITGSDETGPQDVVLTGRGVAAPVEGPEPSVDPAGSGPATDPLPSLVPAAIGPPLDAQSVPKPGPSLRIVRLRLDRPGRRLTIVGLASPKAAGALSLTLSAKVARRIVIVTTGRRLHGGRFVVHVTLPPGARAFRSLAVRARFAGSRSVAAGTSTMVLVRAR